VGREFARLRRPGAVSAVRVEQISGQRPRRPKATEFAACPQLLLAAAADRRAAQARSSRSGSDAHQPRDHLALALRAIAERPPEVDERRVPGTAKAI
jgi:hypothetical protein